jgi:hypothetical protein
MLAGSVKILRKHGTFHLRKAMPFSHLQMICLCFAVGSSVGVCAGVPRPKGVEINQGQEPLQGRLIFLARNTDGSAASNDTATGVYQYSFSDRQLRLLTQAPVGRFFAGNDGKTFCVLPVPKSRSWETGAQAFVYSELNHRGRTLDLGRFPRETAVVSTHAFFGMKGADGNTYILDYDTERESSREFEMPGASQWQYREYSMLHAAPNQTNGLHFLWQRGGQRLRDGQDYPPGYYNLAVDTGSLKRIGDLDNDRFEFRAADGRYIHFRGASAPIAGNELVSSEHKATAPNDSKAEPVRLLHRFPSRLGINYGLLQLSPCKNYALVQESGTSGSPLGSSSPIHRLHLVDLSSGKTRILMQSVAGGYIARVLWIDGTPSSSEADGIAREGPPANRAALPKLPPAEPEKQSEAGSTNLLSVTLELLVATTDRFAKDAAAQGHRLIYSDLGPDGLERSAPDFLKEWCKRCSHGKVRLRPASEAIIDNKGVRDRRTGERGIALMIINIVPIDSEYAVTFGWYERVGGGMPQLQYRLVKAGKAWRALAPTAGKQ